jgi:hypothetical protein
MARTLTWFADRRLCIAGAYSLILGDLAAQNVWLNLPATFNSPSS